MMSLHADFLRLPIAHRGLHRPGLPENSMAAFRAAIANGYGIECDIQRSRDGQRSRQEHGVERGFQGTEGQRRKAQLGFVVSAGGRRLPDVAGRVIVLVPDFAPQRAPGDFRVRVVDDQTLQLAIALHQHAVGARRQGGQSLAFSNWLDQQGAVCSAVEHTDFAGRILGDHST